MPYRNKNKQFAPHFYYHIYARGINKQEIYTTPSDYTYFLYLFKKYLTKDFKETKMNAYGEEIEIPVDSMFGLVELRAFSLLPNHFHLLLFNIDRDGVTGLMRRVLTSYVRRYNSKYKRQGPLIQGTYRSVPVNGDLQLTTVGAYIHTNSVKHGQCKKAIDYDYSSYKYYLNKKSLDWFVLDNHLLESLDFKNLESYLSNDIQREYAQEIGV